MANKRITDVDFLESLNSDESFFVNQNNTIKQINKNNIVFNIANGGTGATDAATARTNLKITPANIGAVSTSGGTITGDLTLGDGTNTSQHDLYIRRLMDEVLKSGRLYWGTGGVLRLQAASDETTFNYLDLKTGSTEFKQPVSVSSGGTGHDFSDIPACSILRNSSDNTGIWYTPTKNGAFYATGDNALPKFGTLPIAQGGTGATTADAALSNLGGVSKTGGTMTGVLDMDAQILMKNGIAIKWEDSEGTAQNVIYLSPANRIQIGYGMPDNYAVQINPMIRLTSNNYGATLPSAGNSGRIFFKKVSS